MGSYVTDKNDMKFSSQEALKKVQDIIHEADEALNDTSRTIGDSPISDVLAGTAGAGIGATLSFAALYSLGVTGLSAAGITSGLATAGALIGGGMVAGIGVLAAPIAGLAALGVYLASENRNEKLKQAKELIYKEALRKQTAIIKELEKERNADKERIEYLNSLNILLRAAIKDLEHDLGIAA